MNRLPLLGCFMIFSCALFGADFQKAKIVEVGNDKVPVAPILVHNPNPSQPPLSVGGSRPVVTVTVVMDGIRYTGQYAPRVLYDKKSGFTRDAIALGSEINARVDLNVKRGTDELVLQNSAGKSVRGPIVRKAIAP
jgi:hypothetical protein